MGRGRQQNRNQQQRAKRRAADTFKEIDAQDGNDTGRHNDPVLVGKRANTRTLPSQRRRPRYSRARGR